MPSRLSHSRMAVDFPRRGLLLGDEVVQAEHHQRVRVGEDSLVDRQLVARLVDALVDGHRMPGRLAHDLLEGEGGAVEQLQGAGDPLEEVHPVPLGLLEARPGHPADLGHGREAIVQLGRVAVALPRDSSRSSRC